MNYCVITTALLGASLSAGALHSQTFADSVVSYLSGTGITAGYDNPASALGEPSRVTVHDFGGPVDPFSPPFLATQLTAIGAGGSLTVGFPSPISNNPQNPYGLDFQIFGNAGFIIINGDFTGGGITDGSAFGQNSGASEVWVSANNVDYFRLDPNRAPVVDGLFPTDGQGNFGLPLNPGLTAEDFNNQGLIGIRDLYDGSAGGTAFDIDWATDGNDQPVHLDDIQFIRVDVISGSAEIDGFASITPVPEPQHFALATGLAALLFAGWFRKFQSRGIHC